MKTWHLFEAIGLVDDRLVEEAADARRNAAPWGKWLAAAACAVLLVSVGTVGAGTILRGCGSGVVKSEAASDSAAPAAAEAAEEGAPAEPSAAPMDAAPAPEPSGESAAGAAEPEAAPEYSAATSGGAGPETAEMPEEELGGLSGVENDGGTDAVPELHSENENLRVSTPEVRYEETGRYARYTVENQSAGALTGTLRFSIDTDENGIEGSFLNIEADGGAVPFTVREAEADKVPPETEGTRHYLVWFDVTVPANGSVEVEIRF